MKHVGLGNAKQQRDRGKSRERLGALRNFIATEANRTAGIFDSDWYLAEYPDVGTSGQAALEHYLNHGHQEGRDPGPNFSTDFYRDTYPDVLMNGLNPLVDYVQSGRARGRAPNPRDLAQQRARAEARHVVVKELVIAPGTDAAILIAHAPAGRLKPHVLPYMALLRNAGLAVMLVVAVDRPLELLETETAAADGIVVRDNGGYDFGALAHVLRLQPAFYGAGLLVITNDSIVANTDSTVFAAMMARLRACRADIVGLTASHEYGWHIQSYFLALKTPALCSTTFQDFVGDIRRLADKDEVIRAYEVPFAARMRAGGLTVGVLFAAPYSANPTVFSWRELIKQGFPFIKLLLLREQFTHVLDQHGMREELRQQWPEVLAKAGFDIDLVRAAVRAADLPALPPGPDSGLVIDAEPFEAITADHALRLAYFALWHDESALGAISREVLCALDHAPVQLNAYPIAAPSLRHRQLCPAVPRLDFAGRPDIAVVHLNPDAWHMLSDEQLEIVRSAKQRIGYWSCDTDTLPAAWQPHLRSVDRVWTPSRHCADIFAAAVHGPIDVVPYPVPPLTSIGEDRATIASEQQHSYTSVARIMAASFAAVIADSMANARSFAPRPRRPIFPSAPPEVTVDPAAGELFDQLIAADGVVPVALGDDLGWNGDPLPGAGTDDWLVFAPRTARACPGFYPLLCAAAGKRPDVVLFYGDDVAAGEPALDRIRLKPEFDRTLLAAQDYIGAPVMIRRNALLEIDGLDATKGSAVLYDLVLRVAQAGGAIARIPQVLLSHQGRRPVADIVSRRLALTRTRGSENQEFADGEAPGLIVERQRFAADGYPRVTIAVPTRRASRTTNGTYVEALLAAIARADWPMALITVIVGDDLRGQPDWAHDRWPFKLVRIETPRADGEAFNYAAKMNLLWRAAQDEQIVFLNDDVTPHHPRWLAALIGFARDKAVGGVGARLCYEDGSLQHAGMFPAFRSVVHGWLGWAAAARTYQDWALAQREWSMVTGAVFATRRSILEQVNGFDEKFSLEFNDVDLCLRIRNLGYRIVYNPDAQFTHVEKASRGETSPPGAEMALFRSRWSRWLEQDPAWHPGFMADRIDPVPQWDGSAWFSREQPAP